VKGTLHRCFKCKGYFRIIEGDSEEDHTSQDGRPICKQCRPKGHMRKTGWDGMFHAPTKRRNTGRRLRS